MCCFFKKSTLTIFAILLKNTKKIKKEEKNSSRFFFFYTIKNISELVSELNSGASIQQDVTAYTQHVNGSKGYFFTRSCFCGLKLDLNLKT